MALSTKINQGFAAVGTKVKELDLSTVKSVNSVTPNSSGNVKITTVTGNAGSATKLQTARTISLTGDVSGSVSFDGSDNVSITTTVADDSHNHVISNIDNLQTTLDAKAPLASPTLTGTPKAPTATAGTNTTQIATTAFVKAAVDAKTSVTSATKATQDASGNVITSTYATKTELSTGLAGKSDTSHGHDAVTQSAAGFMSAADKKKLDGIAEGANNYTYTLPTASSTLGGVKTTSTVTSTSGLTACPIISGVPYYKDTNNTYTLSSFSVTATAAELNVLDGITATTAELNFCDGVTSNIQTQLNGKLSTSGTAAKATADASGNTITSTYATKTELNGKANSATTLSGYGITDAYTKSQVQNNFLQGISTETNYDINKAFDGKMYMVKNGASCPSGSQYGVVLGMPYRQMAGNSKTDFGAQIFLPNGDDSTHPNSMFYRTSLGDAWNAWQEVATTSYVSSNYLGKTAKAASATSADSATKATQDGSGNTITNTYAKLSSAAFTGAISGTTATFSGAVKGASFQATSDIRKKSDLEKIENCLEKIEKLTAYTYSLEGDDSGRRAGLIAQEVQKVLPEAIREDEQGFLSLDYNGVIGLILGSIKELHEEIKELKK